MATEFVRISGQQVFFVSFTEEETTYSGEEVRSFFNTPLSNRSYPKRAWTGQTIPYPPSEIAVVRALVGNGMVNLACTGPAFEGATPTCRILIGEAPYVRDWTAPDGYRKVFVFKFREV